MDGAKLGSRVGSEEEEEKALSYIEVALKRIGQDMVSTEGMFAMRQLRIYICTRGRLLVPRSGCGSLVNGGIGA
eukprot:14681141-Ditylum_brightwellii.AAC.1